MTILTGRTEARRQLCASCRVRIKVGEPRALDSWPTRLNLSQTQVDLLLVAAAEFRDLSDDAGEYADAVAFVDWMAPDALRPSYTSPVKAESPVLRTGDYRARRSA